MTYTLWNPAHVLSHLLPRKKERTYNLRPRTHQCILPISSVAALQLLRIVLSICYPRILIDVNTVSRIKQCVCCSFFHFAVYVVVKCKSYAYVIGLLKNTLTYLLTYLCSPRLEGTIRKLLRILLNSASPTIYLLTYFLTHSLV